MPVRDAMSRRRQIQLGILAFLDKSVIEAGVAVAVHEDRDRWQDDPNTEPVLRRLATAGDGQPYWELRSILRLLARLLKVDSYLEIGVRTGWSIEQVIRERPHATVVAFDMWCEDYAGVRNGTPEQMRSLAATLGHRGSLFCVSGDSHATLPAFLVASRIKPEPLLFDLVTVDGDHAPEGARQDLDMVAPLVKPGGAIVFDDLAHEKHSELLGVWGDFERDHPEFICVTNTRDYPGTGLGFRTPMPKAFPRRLRDKPRRAAPRSDRQSELTAEAVGFSANARAQRDARLAVRSEALSAEMVDIQRDRQLKQEKLESLAGHLEEVRGDRAAKAEVIERLGAELEMLKTDRSEKEAVIDKLVGERGAIERDYETRRQVNERLETDLVAVRRDQAAKEQVIANLAGTLASKDQVIAQLSSDLAEYEHLAWGAGHLLLRAKRSLGRRARSLSQRLWSKRRAPASAPLRPAAMAPQTRPLNVAIDCFQIEFGVSGGVEVYMRTLVRALLAHSDRVRVTLLCTEEQGAGFRKEFDHHVAYSVSRREPLVAAAVAAQDAIGGGARAPADHHAIFFSKLHHETGIDILHSPVQVFSRCDFTVPGVLNLHDLQHLHHPENFTPGDLEARHRLYGQSARAASAVIASSDFVRRDIVERMGVPAGKVVTIPVAFNPEVESGLSSFTPQQARERYHLPPLFAFFPAQFWVHKNHARVVRALALVRRAAPQYDLKLVFTGYRGHSGWPITEKVIAESGMQEHVLLLDFVPTAHLGALYRLAIFCVMPSLFEASSYPVIEAQMLGCPAMCSNVTSLPELMVDGAGLLFDPHSPEDIADKMLRWLKDPDDRCAHAERGQKRARGAHSLEAYARNVLAVYDSVWKTAS